MAQSLPLYAETYFALRYDAEVPCVEMTWRGYHTSADFRTRNAEVMAARPRHTALVAPVFYFNKVAVETVVDRIGPSPLHVAYLDTLERARDWLKGLGP